MSPTDAIPSAPRSNVPSFSKVIMPPIGTAHPSTVSSKNISSTGIGQMDDPPSNTNPQSSTAAAGIIKPSETPVSVTFGFIPIVPPSVASPQPSPSLSRSRKLGIPSPSKSSGAVAQTPSRTPGTAL